MAPTFSYAILKAIPDARRGERVNVGIVVFLADRLDVRFSDLPKLQAIAAGNWNEYSEGVSHRLAAMFEPKEKPESFISRFALLENVVRLSDIGWFTVDKADQYQARVDSILQALVSRPKPDRTKAATSRINTEIARAFKQANVLAAEDEGPSTHKVVRDLTVSADDDLRADFGVLNGAYHFTATLDLRHVQVVNAAAKGNAAVKAVTLDRARQAFPNSDRIGVYAMPAANGAEYRPLVHLLGEYADITFNWSDPSGRQAYLQRIYSALAPPIDFQLGNEPN